MSSSQLEKTTAPEPADRASTAKPKPPLTQEDLVNLDKPKVLIVGAGIGGLMLGNFLEKGGVQFQILERASEVRPLGKSRVLSCCSFKVRSFTHIYRRSVLLIVFAALMMLSNKQDQR